ncbi:hypothetical protein [Hansschlegelia zhihuaiae]|uniref:hypothetical protein n=1 Tax=Hansschlegelia zhihuaiae TaxID=405005 RepID=UPI0013E8A7DF|nr:hypothetical protein [Hansschlegelia zhihuaiae]
MDTKTSGGAKAPTGKAAKTAAAAPKAGATVASATGGDTLAGEAASLPGGVASDTIAGGLRDTLLGGAANTVSGHGGDTLEGAIDRSIGEALAGRRPLPTPAAEAATAIAEAPVNPLPGSGFLDDPRPLEARFEGLSNAEILSLNARLALLPAADLELFRAELAQAPIDPVRGQGTLEGDDHRRWLDTTVRTAGRLWGGLRALSEGRALPPVTELDAQFALDPDKGPWLRIRATREGHRRAGRAWSTAAAFVSAGDLTDADIAALQADPAIIVEDV